MTKPHAAHRPNKYTEPTRIVTFRVPASLVPAIKKMVYDALEPFKARDEK